MAITFDLRQPCVQQPLFTSRGDVSVSSRRWDLSQKCVSVEGKCLKLQTAVGESWICRQLEPDIHLMSSCEFVAVQIQVNKSSRSAI